MPLVESIPNISEGRRRDVVAECAAAIEAAGASLLDTHTDPDHNRTVFTFAGSPEAVGASALALAAAAVRTIDLRTHRGVHPRMGAIDVMPFVPLADWTLQETADLAREVGRRIAATLAVPVFFYEAAAAGVERARLEAIRRGQFEGLAGRLTQPAWTPDYGPAVPHPSAGAMAIGARRPLIAFNVVLATDRLDLARAIARRVRERDGGLPAVKALGLALPSRGLVQVSLNLVDYTVTAPVDVFDRIVAEANALGVQVQESELVGLAPARALPPSPAIRLRLAGPLRIYTLEAALEAAGL